MGTISASAYENNVMAEFEQKRINPLIKDKSFFFLQQIDDIFLYGPSQKNS